jgi:hypothetical protein
MSRIKNISRSGWFVVGVVAAMLIVPTTAAAVTSSVIIKGGTSAGQAGVTGSHQLMTNGEIQGASGNQADVTPAGQLLNTEAAPDSFFQSPSTLVNTTFAELTAPPTGLALVITTIHIAVDSVTATGFSSQLRFLVETGTTCTGTTVGTFSQTTFAGMVGETDIPLTPGLGVPSGDSLCVIEGFHCASDGLRFRLHGSVE